MSKHTDRLYQNAQEDFRQWCRDYKVPYLPTPDGITRYLQYCLANHGPSATVMRTSAIAKLYREDGRAFDTKYEPLQHVLSIARSQMGDKSKATRRKRKTAKRS
jgi:hypothetical protein